MCLVFRMLIATEPCLLKHLSVPKGRGNSFGKQSGTATGSTLADRRQTRGLAVAFEIERYFGSADGDMSGALIPIRTRLPSTRTMMIVMSLPMRIS